MDRLSPAQRSENMRRITSRNTKPELVVRQAIRSLGFSGYRLHRRDIRGNPDIAWVGKKLAVFVHGCFWHGHDCKEGLRVPKSRAEYWVPKIARTRERDAAHRQALEAMGWDTLVVWECEAAKPSTLEGKLAGFLQRALKRRREE